MKYTSANDTITAMATPVGGAIAIIRLSGPGSLELARQVWRGSRPLAELAARELHLGEGLAADQTAIDRCLAVHFPAPASYTGENMVEISCHGGGLVAREILLSTIMAGARHADPGEFTRRAFLNGKIDLTQAEAVADIIEAHSRMALQLAKRQLDGRLGRTISDLYDQISQLLADIESQLDFPDEEIERTPSPALAATAAAASREITQLLASQREGEVLRNGIRLVLAGPPNVGKSSLMNAILKRDRAIVTHLPGTTRDTLEEFAHIRGIPVRLIDTAGIRAAADLVESAGIERTLASMKEARLILWIVEPGQPAREQEMPAEFDGYPVIRVVNKADLSSGQTEAGNQDRILISALTGAGLEDLFDAIEKLVWRQPHEAEPEIAIGARHAGLLAEALPRLSEAGQCLHDQQLELAATSLRAGLESIGQIHGRTIVPDLLETIFSRFCIGK